MKNPVANVTDLNFGVPLTVVHSFIGMAACSADPMTVTEWRAASVLDRQTQQFLADTAIITISNGGTIHPTFTYSDLILTDLEPGDLIVEVPSRFVQLGLIVRLSSGPHLDAFGHSLSRTIFSKAYSLTSARDTIPPHASPYSSSSHLRDPSVSSTTVLIKVDE